MVNKDFKPSCQVHDILLCIDRSFILGAGALVISLVKHNRGESLKIHICAPQSDLEMISKRLTDCISALFGEDAPEFLLYSAEDLPGFAQIERSLNRRCAMQCIRLVAISELRCRSRYLLYLDADTLCIGALSMLDAYYPSNGEILSASLEKGHDEEICGIHLERYFISGLMLIDMKKWNEQNIGRKSTFYVVRYRPKYPDQDALNAVLENCWHTLDEGVQGFWEVKRNTVFVHFVGAKPWHPWSFSHKPKLVKLFRESAKQLEPNVARWVSFKRTREAFICFEDYSPRFAFKWAAKRLWARRCIKGALYCLMRHYAAKIWQKGIVGMLLMRSNTRS